MTGLLTAMLLSAGGGLGVFLIIRALQPRPVPLAVRTARLRHPHRAPGDDDLTGIRRSLGQRGLRILDTFTFGDRRALDAKLRILDKPIERHAYEKLFAALAGALVPNVFVLVVSAGGVNVPLAAGLIVGAIGAVVGFWYPDLPLDEQVEARQRAFRHALSSYLDLVTIILAGGGGIETALHGAAEAGDGWAFAEIRTALRRADLTGRSPWELFDELGATLDVTELQELAASIALAGGHGARIRTSLAAKADALRAAQAAELEQLAEARSERMIVPVSIMVLGLAMFVFYGAVDAISTDGGAEITHTSQP